MRGGDKVFHWSGGDLRYDQCVQKLALLLENKDAKNVARNRKIDQPASCYNRMRYSLASSATFPKRDGYDTATPMSFSPKVEAYD